ncbi:MAG: hypothetical protein AAFR61_27415 [Bacteroidota bacterium]
MNITAHKLWILLLGLGLSLTALGQSDALVYGEVSLEEIEATPSDFPAYKNASAIITDDMGMVTFEILSQTPFVRYTYVRRMKILSEEGLDLSIIKIPVNRSKGELLVSIEAATHGTNVQGEGVAFPVPRANIKESRNSSGQRVYEINFPFVKVGSVLEYRYSVKSRNIEKLRPYVFQQNYPVLKSEFHAFIPGVFDYLPVQTGNTRELRRIKGNTRRSRQNAFSQSQNPFQGRTGMGRDPFGMGEINRGSVGVTYEIFVMENLAPIQKESFSLGADNYAPTLELRMSRDWLRGKDSQVTFENWDRLNKSVLDSYRLRKIKGKRKFIKREAARVIRGRRGVEGKAKAIFSYVQKRYAWDQSYSFSRPNLNKLQESRKGSNLEINLLLYYLLKEARVPANPVLLSTRDHGRVAPLFPVLDQFNHMLVAVNIKGEEVLLDAIGKKESMGMLPVNHLNQYGFWLSETKGKWIPLLSRSKVNRTIYSRLTMQASGQLSGEYIVESRDYGVILDREKLAEYSDRLSDYLTKEVLVGMETPQISNPELVHEGSEDNPLEIVFDLETADFVEVSGDYIIFNPMLSKRILENPFQSDQRATPVDFPYPLKDAHMLGLRLPEGYTVAQVPEPLRVVMPNDAGTFVFNVMVLDNIIHFTSIVQINRTTFWPEEYEGIKSFFEYVVKKHAEDVIIKKDS